MKPTISNLGAILKSLKFCKGNHMTHQEWPEKPCKNCGRLIRFIKTKSGWTAFELDIFEQHKCTDADAYDHWVHVKPKLNFTLLSFSPAD